MLLSIENYAGKIGRISDQTRKIGSYIQLVYWRSCPVLEAHNVRHSGQTKSCVSPALQVYLE